MSTFHNLHFVQGNNEYDYYPQVDDTLTQSGQPADAKATGDALAEIRDDLSHISGLSETAKTALLACFQHVAWVDEHGQDYYDALYNALYN